MRQVGVVCYICGREFGTRSIGIHEPQCIKKWDSQNNLLPKNKRQQRPVKPVEFDQPFSADPKEKARQLEQINAASNAAASENLVSCQNCSRTFLPNRIESHEKICTSLKMAPGKRLASNSGYYGQRVVVVDGEQVDVVAMQKEKTFSTNTISRKNTIVKNSGTNILQNKVDAQINKNIARGPLQTLPCQFCGKAISHNAINIHIKKCKQRAPDPLPPAAATATCAYCNKQYPQNVMPVHTKNCSAKPKKGEASPPKVIPSIKKQASKQSVRQQDTTPPAPRKQSVRQQETSPPTVRKQWKTEHTPYQRYSPRPGSPRGGTSPRLATPDRLNMSLDPQMLTASEEVVVDLVLGVDPSLVINCMVCGLLVLKSKLNTHYHNYCQKTNLSRSVTIPPSTKLPKPPPEPQPSLVQCEICNRSFRADIIENHEIACAIKNQAALGGEAVQGGGGQYKTNGLSSPTQIMGKVVTGRFVPCINCGKSFTVRSLVIHQKQCMR